ncbi:MAG: flagellar biosynthesis protein FlhA [Phycisphaerales bacterium]
MAQTASSSAGLSRFFEIFDRHRHFLVPGAFLSLIVVLVIPLPAAIMDVLLAFNISLSAVILMTTVYMRRPLDFSVFPSLLLGTTLLRLVLNVATTRLILSAEASSPADVGQVAGKVIEAFGTFVAGQNPIVGVIIFIILVVVQFVVITKGATRMSEVAARFTLDAMPGKQMAIDADLSAGLIDEQQARERREEVTSEADFYGAMDGASKFVRGDAVAGIIITIVNLAGGFAIGAFDKGWSLGQSLEAFTMLTIGDGLVSQVPSFVIAVAAGLIVARAGGDRRIGDEIPAQLASQPTALILIAGFLALLSFTPLPTVPLLFAALAIGGTGWSVNWLSKRDKNAKREEATASAAAEGPAQPEPEDLLAVEAMEIEMGYGLVKLADPNEAGDLMDRIGRIRRTLAGELGIVLPPVRVRDNMNVDQHSYRVKMRDAVVGSGTVYPDLLMAMDSGLATGRIEGIAGKEPAFDLEVIWVEPAQQTRAETMNYTVVDPSTVVTTHLTELVRRHAAELLTREETGALLDQLRKTAPKLVEEVVPGVIKPGELRKVLQSLLEEGVPIRDLETIVETLGDYGALTKDISVLTEYARNALRRTISHQYAEPDDDGRLRLRCVTMDPTADQLINGYINRGAAGTDLQIPPDVARRIASLVSETARPLVEAGFQLIVLTAPGVRAQLKQILDAHLNGAVVLSYNEVDRDVDVESMGLVSLPAEGAVAVGAA